MKLSSENIVRSFLRSICDACWYSGDYEHCAFWSGEKCIMMAAPCEWRINEIIAAREKAVKK